MVTLTPVQRCDDALASRCALKMVFIIIIIIITIIIIIIVSIIIIIIIIIIASLHCLPLSDNRSSLTLGLQVCSDLHYPSPTVCGNTETTGRHHTDLHYPSSTVCHTQTAGLQ